MGFSLCSDGVISREEMKNYFIKAHCHELSKGFSHTFQETTYFTPTFCDHCAGMVRKGFIIQLFSKKYHFSSISAKALVLIIFIILIILAFSF